MPQFTLMSHQRDGVKFLDSVDGIGALLYEPGVGKTGTTLAWIESQADLHKEFRVLVVAPLAAADTWVIQPTAFMDSPVKARMLQGSTASILTKIAAAGSWTGVPDAPISVNHNGTLAKQVSGNRVTILSMSTGAISSWCKNGTAGRTRKVQMLRAIRKYNPHLIVVDESHTIKAATSNVSKAMYQIGQLAPHRIILTGTVTPNNPLDVYGQWRFLAPWTFSDQYTEPWTKTPLSMTKSQQESIRPWPWGRFRDRYAEMGGYGGNNVVGLSSITEQELHDRVAERSHVVRKQDALTLPPVTDVDVHVQLSPKERTAYDDMAQDLQAQMLSGELVEASNALSKIMKLRQIHAGFLKDTETGITHQIGTSLTNTVRDVANVTLAGERRVVVFAYFQSECAALAKALKTAGTTVEVVTGATPAAERLAIRQRFGDVSGNLSPKNAGRVILVAQVSTMALSVNELITAQNAIYASLTERRADWVQSRDRLDRNGQTLPVTFWNVFAPGLIGEVMRDNHKHKGAMEKALLDHVRTYRSTKTRGVK